MTAERAREMWDASAATYDAWYETFEGAVDHRVDLEILRRHLPRGPGATILDAAGGTGRMALPLAQKGYSVTVADISPRMLEVARGKLEGHGLADQVPVVCCDVASLPFPEGSFDLVMCWGGGFAGVGELVRVTRLGGTVSVFFTNKVPAVISAFKQDPPRALALADASPAYVEDRGVRYRAVTIDEASRALEALGLRVSDVRSICGFCDALGIDGDTRTSRGWDPGFFHATVEVVLRLSREPAAAGLSRHLVVYGEKVRPG